jgi:murein DD-endopeptidase MepM/ murein hydrolase activator NlpD
VVARFGAALVIATSLFSIGLPTSADQYTDQIQADQQKRAQADAQIAALRVEIAAAGEQETRLTAIISGLNSQIAATQAQVNSAQDQLNQISADLANAQAALVVAQDELASEKRQLARQLVVIYELQNQSSALTNLLSGGSFNDFWTAVINSRRISDQELHTVDLIHRKQDEVQSDVTRINNEQSQQQVLLTQMSTTLHQLDGQRSAQQDAVRYLQRLQARDLARQQQMEAAVRALDNEIAVLQAEEAAAQAAGGGTGRFVWPDNGPISQGFGCTPYWFEPWDPNCPSRHFHNGLDIAGSCWNHIWAADTGIAHTPPYMSYGYGNYIIIVHGNGWETLYGHMAAFAVQDGQVVGRGQLIGYEGSTGNSTGCHLHFGINRNGNWVNPLDYLP